MTMKSGLCEMALAVSQSPSKRLFVRLSVWPLNLVNRSIDFELLVRAVSVLRGYSGFHLLSATSSGPGAEAAACVWQPNPQSCGVVCDGDERKLLAWVY